MSYVPATLKLRFSAVLLAVTFSLTSGAFAQYPDVPPPPAPAAVETCGGVDMIGELQSKDADAHKRIMEAAANTENAGSLLWKVEKPGVPASHLFGTIHMSDERVAVMPAKAKAALDAAKTVALEVANSSDAGMLEAMTKVPDLVAYIDGKTLQSQLTDGEYKKVQTLVTKMGMPGEAAAVIKPWLISTLLAISDCERKQMEAGKQALDSRIEASAKQRGATVVGLESIESQLKAMAGVPDDQQIQMLKSGLAYVDRTNDLIETLVQLYLKRNLGAAMPFQKELAAKVGVKPEAFEGFNTILIVDRNAKMRDAAKPLFDKGEAFVAVGALHLPGKMGLVTLLREAGYTVTPAD
jgi:uncharacterized protein